MFDSTELSREDTSEELEPLLVLPLRSSPPPRPPFFLGGALRCLGFAKSSLESSVSVRSRLGAAGLRDGTVGGGGRQVERSVGLGRRRGMREGRRWSETTGANGSRIARESNNDRAVVWREARQWRSLTSATDAALVQRERTSH